MNTSETNLPMKNQMKLGLRRFASDERGLSTVEYVILLALIAVATIGVWTNFKDTVKSKVESSDAEIQKL